MRGIDTPSLLDIQNAMERAGQRAAARAKAAAREEISKGVLQLVWAEVVAVAPDNRIQIHRHHNLEPDPGFYQIASPGVIPKVGDDVYGVSGGGATILLGVEPREGFRDLEVVDAAAAAAASDAQAAGDAASSAASAASSAATAATAANTNASGRVSKSGDAMTGQLTLPSTSDPNQDHQAAKVKQVEARVNKSGDSMQGLLTTSAGINPAGGVRYVGQGNQAIASPGELLNWNHNFGEMPNWGGPWQDLGGGLRKPLPVGGEKFGVYVDQWSNNSVKVKNNEASSWGVGVFLWKN